MTECVWKIYRRTPPSDAVTSILIGWMDVVKYEIVVVSFIDDPIEITNDDEHRSVLLDRLLSINRSSAGFGRFQLSVLGSTNISRSDCSDLMLIYDSPIWLQFDKRLLLKHILSPSRLGTVVYRSIVTEYYVDNGYYVDHEQSGGNSSWTALFGLFNSALHVDHYILQGTCKPISPPNTPSLCRRAITGVVTAYLRIIQFISRASCQMMRYIPPFAMFPECQMMEELWSNQSKLENVIRFLGHSPSTGDAPKPIDNAHAVGTYIPLNSARVDRQRRATMNLWTSTIQCVVNMLFGFIIGYALWMGREQGASARAAEIVEPVVSLFDYHSLKCDIWWLMGIPIGLKLNANIMSLLGVASLLCLEVFYVQFGAVFEYMTRDESASLQSSESSEFIGIWDMVESHETIKAKLQCPNEPATESMIHSLVAMVPVLSLYLTVISCSLGGGFMVAMVSDIISFLSWPFDILYGLFLTLYRLEAKCLRICGALIRSTKFNRLMQCTDECRFDGDELFIGVLLFFAFVSLLPTVLVFFIFFLQIMAQIWALLHALSAVRTMIHYFPAASSLHLMWRRKLLCDGFNIQINEGRDIGHRITPRGIGIFGYIRYYLKKNDVNTDALQQRIKMALSSLHVNMHPL